MYPPLRIQPFFEHHCNETGNLFLFEKRYLYNEQDIKEKDVKVNKCVPRTDSINFRATIVFIIRSNSLAWPKEDATCCNLNTNFWKKLLL